MYMERSAVDKNRCTALKDWERLCVHAKHHQTGDQGSLGMEWDMEKLGLVVSGFHLPFDLCWSVVVQGS